MVALNLKKRKEGMEAVNVLGAGNGKTQGGGERRKPGCRKGLFRQRSGEDLEGQDGVPKSRLEEEMATHSSIRAQKNPMDQVTWWATVYGVTKSQTQLSY